MTVANDWMTGRSPTCSSDILYTPIYNPETAQNTSHNFYIVGAPNISRHNWKFRGQGEKATYNWYELSCGAYSHHGYVHYL